MRRVRCDWWTSCVGSVFGNVADNGDKPYEKWLYLGTPEGGRKFSKNRLIEHLSR